MLVTVPLPKSGMIVLPWPRTTTNKRVNGFLNQDLHAATKGKYPIHSQSIQAVFEKYVDARENAKKARECGYGQIRYPYKEKKHFNTKWKKDGFRILDNCKIELSLGIIEGKRQKPITVKVKSLPSGTIKEIELIYDRGLKLAIAYDDGLKANQNLNANTAAVDLGEIHSVAAVTKETAQGIIITGRKLAASNASAIRK